MKEYVSLYDLQTFDKNFQRNSCNALAANAVASAGIDQVAVNNQTIRTLTHNFNVEVEGGTVTNQKRSGRCWMFAATNVMRFEVMKNLNLANMELSQNFPLFWDKLEKSNFFLENIIKTTNEELSSRLLAYLLASPLGDGGQWDMFVNIVNKYGVCPKEAMPETISSSNTMKMDKLLTTLLRKDASILRLEASKGAKTVTLRGLKEVMMSTIYQVLVICLGKPPVTFTYETRDKKNAFVSIKDITPKDFFAKYVKLDLSDYVSIINAPTKDKPFNHSFTVKFLGNIVEGSKVRYLNLPIEELKRLAIAQLKDGQAVWFGSDVGQYSDRVNGFLSENAYDYKTLLSADFTMDKATRLDYGESLMTHAMTLTGVNLEDKDKPTRWKVENSWGSETGKNGFYVMDDSWFDQFTYQIVVNKKYLTKEENKQYLADPIELEPWDPMGSLAL
ncbi:MAG: C1 family peptidase [Bacilli bacterium]